MISHVVLFLFSQRDEKKSTEVGMLTKHLEHTTLVCVTYSLNTLSAKFCKTHLNFFQLGLLLGGVYQMRNFRMRKLVSIFNA